ncbi:ABC transporter permease [Streptomyces sp. SID4985]|uniref:ABC transporter permease n=1 Tax=Streptomyces sp. SID4985 TaxID=2690292 RepID=UPI00136ED06E|nr:ABC transporter permease [Streptomyces sp. SID4985]MYQ48548.1 ABC transporter permease [Streptomyces sp. SID4985]
MNTTAPSTPAPSAPALHTTLLNTAVLRTEFRLFRREPGAVFWILLFPTLLLVVLGSIPSFRESDDALGGQRLIDVYVPVAVLISLIMAGVQSMPQALTGYRERGILRRMSATPVRPAALLTAQMTVQGAAALCSALLALAVGRIAFGVRLPEQPLGYLAALALAALAALALGSVVAAVSGTTKIAGAVGTMVFFPMMFCAGLWLPVQSMPHTLARIVGVTPFGAAARALGEAATGHWPGWEHLGVLALWTVLLTAAAARWFRWE